MRVGVRDEQSQQSVTVVSSLEREKHRTYEILRAGERALERLVGPVQHARLLLREPILKLTARTQTNEKRKRKQKQKHTKSAAQPMPLKTIIGAERRRDAPPPSPCIHPDGPPCSSQGTPA